MSEKEINAKGNSSSDTKKNNAKAIIAIIVAVAALAFVFSNVAPATLRFLFVEFTMPAWAWFLGVLIAGVVIGSLFPWFCPRKKR